MAFVSHQTLPYFVDYSGETRWERPYYLDLDRDKALSAQYGHVFCGSHDVAGACCPNCDRPLLRFLALDTADPRLNLGEGQPPLLSLFYCWRCPVSAGLFYYEFTGENEIDLLRCGIGKPEKNFPHKDYPVSFPRAPAALVQITDEAQAAIRQINQGKRPGSALLRSHPELREPRHQIGGEPILVQQDTEYEIECFICERAMPFLASIGDDCLDPTGFAGNEYVQVLYHYCRDCHVIGAFNQCG